MQQSVEDATLRNASVVSSSRVIDSPATDAGGVKRRIVLALASGLIGGAALGCGMVLFFAIISDRLRRRADVAAALEVPVPVSVGRIAPVPQRWLWLPKMRALDNWRADERQRLARAIEMELPEPRRAGPIGVICIDNAEEVGFAVARAATELATMASQLPSSTSPGMAVSILTWCPQRWAPRMVRLCYVPVEYRSWPAVWPTSRSSATTTKIHHRSI